MKILIFPMAIDPRDEASSDPRGLIGRIGVRNIKLYAVGLVVSKIVKILPIINL